jgi:hypothetical protein
VYNELKGEKIMKRWLKNLFGDLLDFIVSKIIPVAAFLGVIALLIFLKDYDARIDMWVNGDWDRYWLIFFAVIPSVILLLQLFVDGWDELPAWVWLACYASVGLSALISDPRSPIASALCVYANLFFVLYSVYFMLFIGMRKLFPRVIRKGAQWGLIGGSILLLVVPIIISYVLAKEGKLVPHSFEINEIPLVEIAAVVFFLFGMLFDKVIFSGAASGSKITSKSQGRGAPDFEKLYTSAYQAARDSYFDLVDIKGTGNNLTIILKYNHSDHGSKQAYLQRFKNLLASSLSGYDLSGISIKA